MPRVFALQGERAASGRVARERGSIPIETTQKEHECSGMRDSSAGGNT